MLKYIKSGFIQMYETKRLVIIYYLTNLIFAVLLVAPFRTVLNRFAGQSLMGAELAGRMDIDFLLEFLFNKNDLPFIFISMILIMAVLYGAFSLFLSGGAFTIFIRKEKYSSALFWGSAGAYFWRFVRLCLWMVPVLGILFSLQFLWTLIERIIWGSDPYQHISFWGDWIELGLRYVGILLTFIILDYARIYTVITNESIMRKSLLQSLRVVLHHFWQTFGIACVIFILGFATLLLYYPLANLLSASHWIIVLLLLIVQQLFMLTRMALRLALYAAQADFFKMQENH